MPQDELTFLAFLQSFRRGELVAEAERQMEHLLTAVKETGGSGALTLKLPVKLNKAGQLEIDPQVSASVPRREIGTGIYYITDDARLTRRDPSQLDMIDELERRRDRAID